MSFRSGVRRAAARKTSHSATSVTPKAQTTVAPVAQRTPMIGPCGGDGDYFVLSIAVTSTFGGAPLSVNRTASPTRTASTIFGDAARKPMVIGGM